MVKDIKNGLMVVDILESGKRTRQMVLVNYFMQMETSMKVSG